MLLLCPSDSVTKGWTKISSSVGLLAGSVVKILVIKFFTARVKSIESGKEYSQCRIFWKVVLESADSKGVCPIRSVYLYKLCQKQRSLESYITTPSAQTSTSYECPVTSITSGGI